MDTHTHAHTHTPVTGLPIDPLLLIIFHTGVSSPAQLVPTISAAGGESTSSCWSCSPDKPLTSVSPSAKILKSELASSQWAYAQVSPISLSTFPPLPPPPLFFSFFRTPRHPFPSQPVSDAKASSLGQASWPASRDRAVACWE